MSSRLVLCVADFSESSPRGLASAVDLARALAGQLLVVRVVSPQGPCVGMGRSVVYLPLGRKPERSRTGLGSFLPALPDLPVEVRTVAGDAAAEVLRLARERSCVAIVLGSKPGQSKMGQVAERVMLEAPCPVMVAAGSEDKTPDGPGIAADTRSSKSIL